MFPGTSQPECADDKDDKSQLPEHMANAELSASLAESLFDNYIEFLGRKVWTGQWIFVSKRDLSPEQHDTSLRMQLYLWEHQHSRTDSRSQSPSADGQQCEKEEDADRSNSEDEDEEETRLCVDIKSLMARVEFLREQNSLMEKNQSFLQSSVAFSGHLVGMVEEYKRKHRDVLLKLYKLVLQLVARATVTISESVIKSEAATIVDYILASHTCFDGNIFVNPAVAVLEWIEKTAPNPVASSPPTNGTEKITLCLETNPLLMDYLISLCSFTANVVPQPTIASPAGNLQSPSTGGGNEDDSRQARTHELFRRKRKKMLKRL